MRIYNKKSLLVIIAIFIFSIYLIHQNIHPYIGIYLNESSQGNYYVSDQDQLGWGAESEIKINDQIVLINQTPPEQHPTVSDDNRVENAETITIVKNGEYQTNRVEYTSELTIQYVFFLIFPIVYFLMNFLLSFLLWKRRSSNRSSLILICLMMSLSICYISAILATKLHSIGEIVFNYTLLITPVLFLHFMYSFLKENNKNWFSKNTIITLYCICFLVFLFICVHSFINVPIDQLRVLLGTFTLVVISILVLLVKGFVFLKRDVLVRTFKWMFYTFIISIAPIILFYSIPVLIMGQRLLRPEIAILFIFFIPTVLVYVLITDKLFEMKLYIQQLSYYLTIALLPAAMVTTVHLLYTSEATVISIIEFFSFILFVCVLFLYIKDFLDSALKANLFVEKIYYQESLYRFSKSIKEQKSTDGIVKALTRELEEMLHIRNVIPVKVSKKNHIVCLDPKQEGDRYHDMCAIITNQSMTIGKIYQYEHCFTIVIGEKSQYFLVLIANKEKHFSLNREISDWLTAIAYYSSISIENILKVEDLLEELKNIKSNKPARWLPRLLYSWSEQERRKLASDIHDTYLQDIVMLKRKIGEVRLLDDRSKIEAGLIELEEDILDINYLIRETSYKLFPPFLMEMKLNRAIIDLINKIHLSSNMRIDFNIDKRLNSEEMDKDIKLALYRITQELLTNANKHSQATRVTMVLTYPNHQIELIYKDNGIGMKLENKTSDTMGLVGIKGRVYSLEGEVELVSEPNKGLEVNINIPVVKDRKVVAYD
ncbi:sensor histidine kinase [Aquibacillus rhizosphaerae]|uniref:Histidine kinase domain-containing protein n=1 Tax=Aquibacillus rhizosphaerae TaxID=3051431 RepID=A0ABT7L2T1_9BACI|nr:ATP-binding protein [Aquibacillus sp. LR5S19]MDL4838911.1 hypothetical protein [Aquibacillus sp. LR5S19]